MCPFSHDPLFIHLCHGVREGPSPLPHLGSRPRLIGSLVRKRLPLVIYYPSHITLSLVRLLCYLMCAKSPQTPIFLHRSSRIDPYQPLWPISLIGEVAKEKKKSGWLRPEVTRLWQNYLPQHLSVNRCDPHDWESNVSAAPCFIGTSLYVIMVLLLICHDAKRLEGNLVSSLFCCNWLLILVCVCAHMCVRETIRGCSSAAAGERRLMLHSVGIFLYLKKIRERKYAC